MMVSELNVSDGQITKFAVQSDVATIVLKDWQGKAHTLTFRDVVGVESYSPENVDLCHIKVSTESENVRKVCSIVEADESEVTEYSFISAWSDLPILSIFSKGVEIAS